jgi:membrane-associated protease RseP (regulator of RpoE activity)
MTERPWYRQPDTFIALAALVVSVSAVVVGLYEAALQRRHDRAEVWPHLEVSTFASDRGATVTLTNSGIGPGIVQSVVVTLDGRQVRSWGDVVRSLLGKPAESATITTVAGTALRPGDRVQLLGLPPSQMPSPFWETIRRVRVSICYASVFDQYWTIDAPLGARDVWRTVDHCPPQRPDADL